MKRQHKKRPLKPQPNIRARRSTPSPRKNSRGALGVLTGGGDCPGLNAALRAVVKGASRAGYTVFGVLEGFKGLYENNMTELQPFDVSGIISMGGTLLGTSRFNPFKHPKTRQVLQANLKKRGIQGLVTIGGEGTQRCAFELNQIGIPCVGVPKTIDNDVYGTDFTFGFDTAVSIATEAIDRLHTTAESHNRIMLVEVMGRHTGWIATYSGIAGGADAVLIPEQKFSLKRLIEILEHRRKMGKKFSIIVVSEDAKVVVDTDGNKPHLLQTPMHQDEYGNLKLGGITYLLEDALRKRTDMEVRSTILGYIQRGGSPTPRDRVLATRLGLVAVDLAIKGKYGYMVGLKGTAIKSIPLSRVVKRLKRVDKKIYQVAEAFFD